MQSMCQPPPPPARLLEICLGTVEYSSLACPAVQMSISRGLLEHCLGSACSLSIASTGASCSASKSPARVNAYVVTPPTPTLTDNSGADVDDAPRDRRWGVPRRAEEPPPGELLFERTGLGVAGRKVHDDFLLFASIHLQHFQVLRGEQLWLVPASKAEEEVKAIVGLPCVGQRRARQLQGLARALEALHRKRDLHPPEDEHTNSHQGVSQQRADGHEVDQILQLKDEGHQGCQETEPT